MEFAYAAAAPLNATLGATTPHAPLMNLRLVPIVIAVACAHGLALWALQSGLVQPSPETPAPVVVMVADLIEPARPEAAPAPQSPQPPPLAQPERPKPEPKPKPVVQHTAPAKPMATPLPEANPAAEPAPTAPAAPATSAPAPAQPERTGNAPPAPPTPAKVELPSSSARYLNNAPPLYPTLSRRMGEQGRVVVRAFIDVNGTASQASIATSSGYERLDQTALKTVLQWRYAPGKRAGTPEAMWFDIPLTFVLD